jgi:hypothetical protein
MISSGRTAKASRLFERLLTPEQRADAKRQALTVAKFQLKHSPENVPATQARINDNSMRLKRGEPINVFTKPSVADKMQTPVSV